MEEGQKRAREDGTPEAQPQVKKFVLKFKNPNLPPTSAPTSAPAPSPVSSVSSVASVASVSSSVTPSPLSVTLPSVPASFSTPAVKTESGPVPATPASVGGSSLKLRIVMPKKLEVQSEPAPFRPPPVTPSGQQQQQQRVPSTIERPRSRVKTEDVRPVVKVDPFESLAPKARAIAATLSGLLDHFEKWDSKKEPVFLWEPTDALVPGYSSVITRPMAWTTMRQNIAKGSYESIESFSLDVLQIVDNAMRFNPEGTFYHEYAIKLLKEARKSLVPHFPGFASLADTRLQLVDAAKNERKRLAAEKAVAAITGALATSDAAAVGGGDEGKAVSSVSSGKRARTARGRLTEMDSEEELAEAEDLLKLSKYKNLDLSYLHPDRLGPLKVPALGSRSLKRRFLYSQVDRLSAPGESLAGETAEVRKWRLRIYGSSSETAEDKYFVSRPAFAVAEEGFDWLASRSKRRYGADVGEIQFDLPQRPDGGSHLNFPLPTRKPQSAAAVVVPELPVEIPKKGRQRLQLEALLRQNALFLLRLKLLKTWYSEADLKKISEYATLVGQIEQNFCSMLS